MTVEPMKISKWDERGTPILELKENMDAKWIGYHFHISPSEKKLIDRLEQKVGIRIYVQSDSIRISTAGYVGVQQFEKFTLNVKPKFDTFERSFGKLMDFTNDVEHKEFEESIEFQEQHNHPIEPVILTFASSVEKLIKNGIYKSYVQNQDDLSFLRGKLVMKQQILNDVRFNMKFNCEFDEFTSNNLENQIIRYTLEQCMFITKFPSTKKSIRKLIHRLDSQIELKRNVGMEDFRKIVYTRLNTRYKHPHGLAKLIIQNIGFKNFNYQKTKSVAPFFIEMWRVWEGFLEKLFSDYCDDSIYVRKQKYDQKHDPKEYATFEPIFVEAWKIHETFHEIKPDLVLFQKGKILTVADAKYMHELKVGGKEMFQIAFYIKHLGLSAGYAILPYENIEDHDIQVSLQNISIKVRHISIDEYLDILYSKKPQNDIKKEMSVKIKELIPLNT